MSFSPLLRRAITQRVTGALCPVTNCYVKRGLATTTKEATTNQTEIDSIYYEPERIPTTHDHVVCNLHFRSFSPNVMDFYMDFTRRVAAAFGIPCSGTVYLPTKTEKWTVLRSPFVHKKAQENFERKHHKRLLQLKDASPETIGRLLAYIERTCPAGIGVKVTTWEHESLGVGKRMGAQVEDELRSAESGLIGNQAAANSYINEMINKFDVDTGGKGNISIDMTSNTVKIDDTEQTKTSDKSIEQPSADTTTETTLDQNASKPNPLQ
ncbi:ribosomal protein S10 domain-containing protein [Syncephalis plumigaleata]|nr:ribosomal protein S10 domain-containing protein [Syncephalis plumigaleata]